jgi:hypothetical protein
MKVFRVELKEIPTRFQQTISNSPHNQAENSPPSFKAVGLQIRTLQAGKIDGLSHRKQNELDTTRYTENENSSLSNVFFIDQSTVRSFLCFTWRNSLS